MILSEGKPALKCAVFLNLSGIYNIDLIFTWQRTCWLFLDVHVHHHNQKNHVTVHVHYDTLFLAVTRSSKFWSLTCGSAVKTFHFCHFCNSFLSTGNAKEWVTAVKIYYSLCTTGGNDRRCLSEGGTSQKLGLPSSRMQTPETVSAGEMFCIVSSSWIFWQQLIYFGGQDDRTLLLCCQQ